MQKSKYSDVQIMSILTQAKNGILVADLCREPRMSSASFYKWRAKFGGMDASLISRMKALDEENKRFKKMYAKKSMQNDLLKEALGKEWKGHPIGRRWPKGLFDVDRSASRLHAERSASAKRAIGTGRNCMMRTS